MAIPGGDARIDLAVINGMFHGFEIKSDRDTLRRLPNQRDAYNTIFDTVTLVAGPKASTKAAALIPGWWGIKVASSCGGLTRIEEIRPARNNPGKANPLALLYLLDRAEVVGLLREYCPSIGAGKFYLHELNSLAAEMIPIAELKTYVRQTLKRRHLIWFTTYVM